MTTERIEVNPTIMMGKPVIRGTRITVDLILRKLAEGASEDELREDYPNVTTEDIRAVMAYGGEQSECKKREVLRATSRPSG
ncbi:MAG TPA: DUF433 domain-containing protein [Candidatus Acidoferrales bacterium]|nr:DUF433 domain-containing protein [Candidatus Acidoferrales bacterium]